MWRTYLDPRPICIVTSLEREGRANAITLGWSMPTSFQPSLLAISVAHTRYSHLLLDRSREFVLKPARANLDIERLVEDVCRHPERSRFFDPPARRHASDVFP